MFSELGQELAGHSNGRNYHWPGARSMSATFHEPTSLSAGQDASYSQNYQPYAHAFTGAAGKNTNVEFEKVQGYSRYGMPETILVQK